MDDNEVRARPVRALSDMEFDQQGTRRTSGATGLSAWPGRAVRTPQHSHAYVGARVHASPLPLRTRDEPSELGVDLFEVV
jgi:hypothetical protein